MSFSAVCLLMVLVAPPAARAAERARVEIQACHSLSIVTNPSDGGTAQVQTPPNCRGGYREGTVVAVRASRAPGYFLASWTSSGGSVQDPDSPVTALIVAGPTALGANFVRQLRPPTAHFVVSPAAPRAHEAVQFTDTSSGFPTSWVWDIDGDGRVDTTDRNPTFVFGAPGVYTTRLTAANHAGSSVTTTVVTIVASPEGLDAVDPNPELLNRDGTITQNPSRVAASTRIAVGAAADGATRLVFRYAAPAAGQVTFSLAGGSPANDGGFLASASSERAASVTVPAAPVGAGFLGFAIYLVPDDFNLPSGFETSHDRPFTVTASFTPEGGPASPPVPLSLNLYRPPIVLLHGLWSNSSVWTMPLIDLPYLDIPTPFADYRHTNADRLAVNLEVPELAVQRVLAWDRDQRIAATRADFIAHSMGGLLARLWVADSQYAAPGNFEAGDIHKLITLDTPHLGARSATYVRGLGDEIIVGDVFAAAMYEAGMPINDGAVDDLEFFSAAIDAIGLAEVGSHALAGVGGSDYDGFCPGLSGDFIRIVAFFARDSVPELLTTIFGAEPNDAVVGLDSQNGTLPPEATSTPIPGPDGVHFCVTASGVYTDAILDLLNTPVTSSTFQFFPPVITGTEASGARPAPRFAALPSGGKATHSTLSIRPLLGGPIRSPGGAVRVTVRASSDVDRVLLIAGGEALDTDDAPPFEFDITLPATAAGPFRLLAIGDDGDGFAISEPLEMNVVPASAIASLEGRPSALNLIAGEPPATLEADARYEDGVVRTITGILGTEYVSSDATVVTVSASGLVTPVGAGRATVTIRNGAVAADVPVAVFGTGEASCLRCTVVVPAR